MTARTPYQAGGVDVSVTLGELERKLRELEQELNATARPAPGGAASATPSVPSVPPAPAAPAPVPAPDADALIAQARARLGTLDGQVDELLRFREQLHRTARELEDEYSRVLSRIGAPAAPAGALAPPPPPISDQAPPAPAAGPVRAPIGPAVDESALLAGHPAFAQPAQTLAAPADEPAPAVAPVPVAPASPHEDASFEGAIVLDAGPFTDIAALSAFEQGLARVPAAEDVYVSGFEGNRALVELRLAQPVALVREMRAAVPAGFTVTDAAAGRLRLDVTATASGG